MSSYLNTHYYDRSLKEGYRELVKKQDKDTDFLSINMPIHTLFDELYNTLNLLRIIDGDIRNMLELIRNDTKNNYDPLNDIDTMDILNRTWYYVRKMELIDRIMLFKQIEEIKNGPCPQGRTTRIYQIYFYCVS
jgi:hypothetical protein